MTAVILAAGKGSRLGALGEATPKPLIPVSGKCPLERHLESCARAGVERVFINTHHLADAIRTFAGDGSRFGLTIRYSFEPELLGTAGALNNFRDDIGGGAIFVLYGDNVLECDLQALGAEHDRSRAVATIALHPREDVSTSGMVVLDDGGRITRFVEKPPKELQVSNLVNAGVYCLDPSVLMRIPAGVSDFGHDIFPGLLADGAHLQGFVLEGDVLPIDTPELLARARGMGSTENQVPSRADRTEPVPPEVFEP